MFILYTHIITMQPVFQTIFNTGHPLRAFTGNLLKICIIHMKNAKMFAFLPLKTVLAPSAINFADVIEKHAASMYNETA